MNASTQPQTVNRIDCLCGCGQNTGPKANYRPGHDAAHVSVLLGDFIAKGDLSQVALKPYLAALPSDALKIKLQKAVDNFAAKKAGKKPRAAKVERTEWVEVDTDEYKLGRWTYPVQALMIKEGIEPAYPGEESEYKELRRNTKRDGSGEWVALEGGELIGR
ncbi:hypothetical protein SEA_CICADA_63 [Microbacterium phage Cicada]|nr:hypothetical protein SEA_CICADA_63 [Microbacterium phage Cicada]